MRTHELDHCIECDERGRGISGRNRHAALARRSHPADLSVFLQAEVDRLAPLVGLVVVGAARVEAQVAAERAHVAQVWRRDLSCRLAKRSRRLLALDHFGQRQAGAEGAVQFFQLVDLPERDQHLRRLMAALHVRQQIGAAGDQHRTRAFAGEDLCRLRYGAGRAMLKPRQS